MQCSKCSATIRSDSKVPICKPCLSVCECGAKKDPRAINCISCGMSKKALTQWDKPSTRKKIHGALIKSWEKRRTNFEDLNWDDFTSVKIEDGRFYTDYWDGDRKRSIYRYQWVWIKAHREIPKGLSVHHKNHNCTDDRIENLELLTKSDHAKHHNSLKAHNDAKAVEHQPRVCECCGIGFTQSKKLYRVQKYCSAFCYKTTQVKNATYEWKTCARVSKTDRRLIKSI